MPRPRSGPLGTPAGCSAGTPCRTPPPRTRAQVEQLHRDRPPGEHHLRLAPVDLGLLARLVDLGHEHVARLTQLAPTRGDVLAHRALSDLRAVFVDQPPPDPPRRVP